MNAPTPPVNTRVGPATAESLAALSEARQAVYAAGRRDWAERVGRPYDDETDPRPPPGELDAVAHE